MPTLRSPAAQAALMGLLELLLTAVHHVYGAYVYDTPWRVQVAFYAAIIGAFVGTLSYAAHRWRDSAFGKVLFRLNMLVTLVAPALAIGVVEGGYNHALKNIVYFAGDIDLYRQWFPEPTYEIPADWFFEVTGVLQFPLGVWAGVAAVVALFRRRAR